jgi:hypothetical protein
VKIILALLTAALLLFVGGCLNLASKTCLLGCGFIPQDNIYVSTGKSLCDAFCKSNLVAEGDKWWNEKVTNPEGWLGKFNEWLQKYVGPEVVKAKTKAKTKVAPAPAEKK